MSAAQHNLSAAAALVDGLGALPVVVSPGSRSTPLALAALDRRDVHVVLDERAAGFVALGLARASGRPAVLVCTSGSAGANYLPAVVEAHEAQVPLIVLTANRPPELHHSGAPQCMRQDGLFRGWVRHEAVLPVPCREVSPRVHLQAGARAAATAVMEAGPVHLDVPFREPLWSSEVSLPQPLPAPRAAVGERNLDAGTLDAIAQDWSRRRGVMVAGPAIGAPCAEAALAFARAAGWTVLADPASGLRFAGEDVIGTYDLACRAESLDALRPDLAVTFGLSATSKPLRQWLDRLAVARVHVAPQGRWTDPDHRLESVVAAAPALLFRALAGRVAGSGDPRWGAVDRGVREAIAGPLEEGFWSGRLARSLTSRLPPHAQLHLASSMPIREVDAFVPSRAHGPRVHASRGVNGIDGTIATALGEALDHDGPTALLIGDLATLHDLDGLEAAVSTEAPLTICVLDNGGGGIFEHLPIAQHPDPERFEKLFLTPRSADVARAAEGLGARVSVHDAMGTWTGALDEALERRGLDVIVAKVDRARDLAHHQRCRSLATSAVRRALGGVS